MRSNRWGVKWLLEVLPSQREALVNEASDPKWRPYHYDFPGLLRELIRLISRGAITPEQARAFCFCSAFVQRAYTDVLGRHTRFNMAIRDENTSPDDLRYRPIGARIGPAPTVF